MVLYFCLLLFLCLLPLYLQGTNLFNLLKFVNYVSFTYHVLSTHFKILGVSNDNVEVRLCALI